MKATLFEMWSLHCLFVFCNSVPLTIGVAAVREFEIRVEMKEEISYRS
jgi:hypothetical protein